MTSIIFVTYNDFLQSTQMYVNTVFAHTFQICSLLCSLLSIRIVQIAILCLSEEKKKQQVKKAQCNKAKSVCRGWLIV